MIVSKRVIKEFKKALSPKLAANYLLMFSCKLVIRSPKSARYNFKSSLKVRHTFELRRNSNSTFAWFESQCWCSHHPLGYPGHRHHTHRSVPAGPNAVVGGWGEWRWWKWIFKKNMLSAIKSPQLVKVYKQTYFAARSGSTISGGFSGFVLGKILRRRHFCLELCESRSTGFTWMILHLSTEVSFFWFWLQKN